MPRRWISPEVREAREKARIQESLEGIKNVDLAIAVTADPRELAALHAIKEQYEKELVSCRNYLDACKARKEIDEIADRVVQRAAVRTDTTLGPWLRSLARTAIEKFTKP